MTIALKILKEECPNAHTLSYRKAVVAMEKYAQLMVEVQLNRIGLSQKQADEIARKRKTKTERKKMAEVWNQLELGL